MPSDRRGAADGGFAVAKASDEAQGHSPGPQSRRLRPSRSGFSWLQASAIGHEAQRADAPRIVVASTILAEPASQAALAIQVGPPGSVPGNTFVRLRGLPASVSLTEGYAIAPGSWAVPLFGLPTLKAIVPAGVAGRSEIIIHLVGVDGTTLAETRTALVVGPAAAHRSRRRSGSHPIVRRRARALPSRHRRLHKRRLPSAARSRRQA